MIEVDRAEIVCHTTERRLRKVYGERLSEDVARAKIEKQGFTFDKLVPAIVERLSASKGYTYPVRTWVITESKHKDSEIGHMIHARYLDVTETGRVSILPRYGDDATKWAVDDTLIDVAETLKSSKVPPRSARGAVYKDSADQ